MALNLGSYIGKLATYESRNNPNAVSPTGATGLYQFTRGTGRQYGLVGSGFDIRNDPDASTTAVTKLTNDNANYLQSRGVPVTEQSLYIAHNIGAGNAVALYNNPDSIATSVVSSPSVITVNNGRGLTSSQFIDLHSSRGGFEAVAPGGASNSNGVTAGDGLTYNPSGYSPVGTGGGAGGVETSVGTKVLSENYGSDHGEVVFGNDDGQGNTGFAIGGTQGIDASSFTSARLASPDAGSFGLSGITSGGQTVGGTGSALSLDGATLDKSVSAESVAGSGDNIAGWNAAGPVMTNPAVVGAINTSGQKVSGSVDKGAKQIGSDTKEAGKTIGQSVTGLASTVKGISESWQSWAGDTFLRLAFIVVGLVLFAAALWYFARPQITAAAGVVADVVPAGRVAKLAVGLAKRRKA